MTDETAIAAIPALAAVTVSRSPVTNYFANMESEGSKTTARSCLRNNLLPHNAHYQTQKLTILEDWRMKALTIKAPWAQLILAGVPAWKDIENRDWWTTFRGPFAVHVSKRTDPAEVEAAAHLIRKWGIQIEIPTMEELKRQAGTVLGVVEIVDCVRQSPSPWFVGDYGFVLANPRSLAEPVHCRGMLGFWDVPPLTLNLIEKQLGERCD